MKFARIVFLIAGLHGFLSLPPLYFLFGYVGRHYPPPITHPEFYYGFAGVGLAFQVVFFVISSDPARFRPMIVPSVLEKLSYAAAVVVLYLQGRMSPTQAATAVPDSILCVLFVIAFFQAPSAANVGAEGTSLWTRSR